MKVDIKDGWYLVTRKAENNVVLHDEYIRELRRIKQGGETVSEFLLQKILSNQEKIISHLVTLEKAVNDLQNGQRTLYVGQRNLEMELKGVSVELIFLKHIVKEDLVKKINVLVDDAQKRANNETRHETGLFEEFAKLKATISDEDIKRFEQAKCNTEKE